MSYLNLNGTTKQKFQIGLDGIQVANNNDTEAQILNSQDELTPIQVGEASDLSHATTKRYVKRRIIKISAAFDGNTAPNPGDNTGKYLICHTTGGTYTVGKIYYDTGSELTLIEDDNRFIYIACADFNGTISMKEKYVYLYDEDTSTWLALFDAATAFDGTDQLIIIDLGTGASYESSTTIPSNGYILRTSLKIAEAYDIGTEIEIKLKNSGTILMSSSQNRASRANEYVVDDIIKMTSNDNIEVTIDGSPSNGSGFAMIEFTIPLR